MIEWVQPGADLVVDLGVGAGFALALLVLHDATLLIEHVLGNGAQQVGHAIAFHPQRHVECARRNGRVVVGAILGGRAIHAGRAGVGERREELAIAILGALEHQVLEQMGKTGLTFGLVLRADPVPHADEHGRNGMIGVHQDGQAIVQPKHLVGNIDLGCDLVAALSCGGAR